MSMVTNPTITRLETKAVSAKVLRHTKKPVAVSQDYVLRLYVTGATPRSTRAIANIRSICEEHLHDHYSLEVIDVYQQPELAKLEDIVAMPTLIKQHPDPVRRLVGDLSMRERVVLGLDIHVE
jgi:circadian clock protein KaiB